MYLVHVLSSLHRIKVIMWNPALTLHGLSGVRKFLYNVFLQWGSAVVWTVLSDIFFYFSGLLSGKCKNHDLKVWYKIKTRELYPLSQAEKNIYGTNNLMSLKQFILFNVCTGNFPLVNIWEGMIISFHLLSGCSTTENATCQLLILLGIEKLFFFDWRADFSICLFFFFFFYPLLFKNNLFLTQFLQILTDTFSAQVVCSFFTQLYH